MRIFEFLSPWRISVKKFTKCRKNIFLKLREGQKRCSFIFFIETITLSVDKTPAVLAGKFEFSPAPELDAMTSEMTWCDIS